MKELLFPTEEEYMKEISYLAAEREIMERWWWEDEENKRKDAIIKLEINDGKTKLVEVSGVIKERV